MLLFAASCTLNAQSLQQSEFFLEIREGGNFEVYLDDEMISSSKGRFRFFEMKPGRSQLVIKLNNRRLYQGDVRLVPGNRIIAYYSRSSGLETRSELPLYSRGHYLPDNWSGLRSPGGQWDDGRPQRVQSVLHEREFTRLREALKKEAFDDSREKLFKLSLRNTYLSVEQLAQLLNLFSFDDRKLECAIFGYDRVADRRNFYLIRDVFRFTSTREKLDEFILGKD